MKDWNKIIEFGNKNVNNNNFFKVYLIRNNATNDIYKVTFVNKKDALNQAAYLYDKYNMEHVVIETCAHIQ